MFVTITTTEPDVIDVEAIRQALEGLNYYVAEIIVEEVSA